jgi:hypothetical protein
VRYGYVRRPLDYLSICCVRAVLGSVMLAVNLLVGVAIRACMQLNAYCTLHAGRARCACVILRERRR